ncbi:hypothetical protein B0H65DRAFT_1120 [Neurospora tetraspora]|uniref:Secreted protein n=1 Tax=Neurospora tetraspora TaxID=94610 RepID=A0AAE0MV53_9PEZI|nr:hypothetical protein B0H65DRAFT_1120 [Neurospora tetraspora]
MVDRNSLLMLFVFFFYRIKCFTPPFRCRCGKKKQKPNKNAISQCRNTCVATSVSFDCKMNQWKMDETGKAWYLLRERQMVGNFWVILSAVKGRPRLESRALSAQGEATI